MILWYGRIQTTDHDNSWQVDGGVRLDGWTVRLTNGNGRQTMVIFHRWTEVDGRTKTDRSPHGRIRTTDCSILLLLKQLVLGFQVFYLQTDIYSGKRSLYTMCFYDHSEFGMQILNTDQYLFEIFVTMSHQDHDYLSQMDGVGRWTIKNMKMLTEVDGLTYGRKSVRRGLIGKFSRTCQTYKNSNDNGLRCMKMTQPTKQIGRHEFTRALIMIYPINKKKEIYMHVWALDVRH